MGRPLANRHRSGPTTSRRAGSSGRPHGRAGSLPGLVLVRDALQRHPFQTAHPDHSKAVEEAHETEVSAEMKLFPAMLLHSWGDTKETLHRFCQIVGKLRLAASVRRNHWWHAPFHLTDRGITTQPMGRSDGGPVFAIDFVDHQLRIHTLDGRGGVVPLQGQSVASIHDNVMAALDRFGVEVAISIPRPFDLPDADRRFADDTTRAGYDPAWATRYWRVLSQVNLLLEEFAAGYEGKVSRAPFLAHLRHHSQPVLGPPGSTRSRPPTRSLGRPARGR
jgi:hypothetical protein